MSKHLQLFIRNSLEILSKFKENPFRIITIRKGETWSYNVQNERFHMVFVLEGYIVDTADQDNRLYTREFTLLTDTEEAEETKFKAIENTRLFHYGFYDLPEPLYRHFFSLLQPASDYFVQPYIITPELDKFLAGLEAYVEADCMKDEMLLLKEMELFLILRRCYTEEDLSVLLAPVLSRLHRFRQQIIGFLPNVRSAKELMKLTGMKRTTFEKKFRREFGTSAHQWLLKRKAEEVRETLLNQDLPIDDIRKKHGFNSATHFVRFCRQQFGCTPTQLRKQLLKVTNNK